MRIRKNNQTYNPECHTNYGNEQGTQLNRRILRCRALILCFVVLMAIGGLGILLPSPAQATPITGIWSWLPWIVNLLEIPTTAIDIEVFETDESPAGIVQLTLWRKLQPDETEKLGADRVYWRETGTGDVWSPEGHSQTERTGQFTISSIGVYRISACRVNRDKRYDPTPGGLSEPIEIEDVAGTRKTKIQLEGDTPLKLKFYDDDTDQPLSYVSMRLFREDGLPIGYGSQNFVLQTGDEGVVEFGSLIPGVYNLTVWRRAYRFGDGEYPGLENHPVLVEKGKRNRVNIPLKAIKLEQEEIDKRWPFIVTGKITDAAGSPLAGVKLIAHCSLRNGNIVSHRRDAKRAGWPL